MEEEFELNDYFVMIKKNLLLSIIIFLLVLGGITLYTFTSAPVYEARSLVMVTTQDSSLLLEGTGQRLDIDTQREIILSSSVLGSIYDGSVYPDVELSVDPIKNSNVIEITVQSKSAITAMRTANNIAESYVNYTQNARKSEASEVNDFISEQLDVYKEEIDFLNEELLDYNSKKADYKIELDSINNQISDYQNKKDDYQLQLDTLNAQAAYYKGETGLTTTEKRAYESIKEQIVAQRNLIAAKKSLYDGLVSRRDEIRGITTQMDMEYQSMVQELSAKDDLYNYLLSRREEINIVEKETSGNAKIIETAIVPFYPVKPNKPLNLALGFVLAIIASVGVVFLKESIKNTFKSSKEIEQEFGPVILGNIPLRSRSEDESDQKWGPFKKFRESKKQEKPYTLDNQPGGMFVESFRILRTNVMFYLKDNNIKVVNVSSSQTSDGKSTVAANLALSLSKTGKKVLLVDANLRDPVQHKIFKMKPAEGLADAILNDIKLDKIITKTTYEHLYIMLAGKIINSPSELISSNKMKEISQKLKSSSFDAVIIDNASFEYSESIIMASNTDATLLVIASDKTNKDAAVSAKDTLKKVKATIMGVVVNFMN